MNLQQIFDRILLLSGQFQIPQGRVEIDVKKFKLLVDLSLGYYSNHVPKIEYLYVNGNNTNSRQITFQETDFPLGIPDLVLDLIPIRISGVVPYYLREYDRPRSNLDIKVEFPWTYRKPTLTIPTNAEFDMKAGYYHHLVNCGTDDNPLWEVSTISDLDDALFDLLVGRFLIGIGRARDAFTIQELPIQTNAQDLISEGREIEKDAKEQITTAKKEWWVAWG